MHESWSKHIFFNGVDKHRNVMYYSIAILVIRICCISGLGGEIFRVSFYIKKPPLAKGGQKERCNPRLNYLIYIIDVNLAKVKMTPSHFCERGRRTHSQPYYW